MQTIENIAVAPTVKEEVICFKGEGIFVLSSDDTLSLETMYQQGNVNRYYFVNEEGENTGEESSNN
ncbi:hypothetical protein HNQ56_004808 [Anaerotaenia torta]|uniref:hypothetical protein n=1 Tax=Anaerotaenia torta TaxID=433293 RepID=UPI003D2532EB